MKFTLVSTVYNENKRLVQTIADLTAQTKPPTEIIITDAGSIDGTYEKLLEWKASSSIPIIIFRRPKCNVAEGRNMAIQASKYSLIVSTDFGCRFHRDWLKSIVRPFSDINVSVVGGAYTVKEEDQTALAAKAAYILYNGYTIDVTKLGFIPSSRSIAFKREVFNKVGGYCEWLTLAADDLVFGKEILALGYKFYPINKPYVYWNRHSSPIGFMKEAYRYGLGDGEAKVNLKNFLSNGISLTLRYIFIIFILGTLASVSFIRLPNTVLFTGVTLFLYSFRCYVSNTRNWIKHKSQKYNFVVFSYSFFLLEATRLSYVNGYVRGFIYSTSFQKEQSKLLKKRLLKV